MNYLIIALGSLILGCAIYVSYNHTIELFVVHGTPYVHALAATVTVELIFVLSALIIVVGKLKNRPIGFIGTAGFLYGASITGWANVSYYASHGISGWLIGIAIPLGVLISESMVTKAITEFSNSRKEQSEQHNEQPAQAAQTEQPEQNGEQAEQTHSEQHSKQTEQLNNEQVKMHSEQRKPKQAAQQKPVQKNSTVQLDFIDNGFGRVAKENYEKIRRAALNYMAEHGRLPGRPTLMKLTGCPQRQVDAVKKELEAELKTA